MEDIGKSPNWFTASRIFGFFFLLLPLLKNNIFSVAFIVFLLLVATDFIDGQLARRKNIVTWLGKGLDPAADKVLLIGTMFMLGIFKMYPVPGSLLVVFEGFLIVIGIAAFLSRNERFALGANSYGKVKAVLEVATASSLFIKRLNIFPVSFDVILFFLWFAAGYALMSILGHFGLLMGIVPKGDTIS